MRTSLLPSPHFPITQQPRNKLTESPKSQLQLLLPLRPLYPHKPLRRPLHQLPVFRPSARQRLRREPGLCPLDGIREGGSALGGRGSHGCEFGVVDGAGGGTAGALDLLENCEEGSDGGVLDDCACDGGVVWRYVLFLAPFPFPSFPFSFFPNPSVQSLFSHMPKKGRRPDEWKQNRFHDLLP